MSLNQSGLQAKEHTTIERMAQKGTVVQDDSQTDHIRTNQGKRKTINQTSSTAIDGSLALTEQKLQRCICGWSKVTSQKGLRIHQSKMKGIRLTSNGQQQREIWKGENQLVPQILPEERVGDHQHRPCPLDREKGTTERKLEKMGTMI